MSQRGQFRETGVSGKIPGKKLEWRWGRSMGARIWETLRQGTDGTMAWFSVPSTQAFTLAAVYPMCVTCALAWWRLGAGYRIACESAWQGPRLKAVHGLFHRRMCRVAFEASIKDPTTQTGKMGSKDFKGKMRPELGSTGWHSDSNKPFDSPQLSESGFFLKCLYA